MTTRWTSSSLKSCCLLLLLGSVGWGQQQAATWPEAKSVEAQPLIAQVQRLGQALEFLGQPLPETTLQALAKLSAEQGDASVASEIQKHLDPFCLAALEISPKGIAKVAKPTAKPELIEQGWRLFLVKVVNNGGSTARLQVNSPSARPIPTGPKTEIGLRWLGLQSYSGQPLLPHLSGLGLEYTVVQLFSRDAGDYSADIHFSLEESGKSTDPKPGPMIREWTFSQGADGWVAANDAQIETKDNRLVVTSTGDDPYIIAPVTANSGRLGLRFWAQFDHGSVGQIFWTSATKPIFDGSRSANFTYRPGKGSEYFVPFNAKESVTSIRIDLGNGKGTTTFDWVNLSYLQEPKSEGSVQVDFIAKPSIPLTFQVTEADGKPTTAGFLITDESGRVYPAQSKRLAPDFFFHPQVYRSSGEQVRLPAGKYRVECTHGPESISEIREVVITEKPAELHYQVKRWIDPSKTGWWSGDHHIHAAGCQHYENPTEGVEPSDMMRHILGEDLKIGCCLTWGPCFDYQKQFFRGRPDDVSQPPYILRYDVEVSGFGSHSSGHLCLLRLKEQIYPGGNSKTHWPTLGMNTLRWAKKQGGVTGPAHSGNGIDRDSGLRVPDTTDGPNSLPNYNIPAYNGIGANEFIVDVTHDVPGPDGKPVPAVDFISTMDTDRRAELNMWYHVLNCGYRVKASGETDFPCIYGERVGIGRVYVKLDGPIDFDQWVQGIADGRSYVSNGQSHLMDFAAESAGKHYELGVAGSEIKLEKPGKVTFKVNAASRVSGRVSLPVELIVNGYPIATQDLACDGVTRALSFDIDLPASSWVALRIFPSAHTNPFFVTVADKPIRANKKSAQWCLMGVDQCWKMKRPTYRGEEVAEAERDYEFARKAYQRILEESPE